jgi:multidrug efflux pump subunit AcrB
MLFLTRTTISVPALMGAIMSIGVATSDSTLVVTFAHEELRFPSELDRSGNRSVLT